MSKVVVIGGNSFSGSNAIKGMLIDGNEVLSIGRSDEIASPFNPYSKYVTKKNFTFIKGRINQEVETTIDAILNFEPRVIFNFAAQSMVAQSWEKPEDWYEANLVGFSKIISGIRNLKTLEKFINFTTPEVYGTTDDWIKESFNFNPTTPYAISRAASDFHLKCMFDSFGFPVIFTRAANVYGPGQQLYRIIPRTILSTYTSEKLPLQGGGNSIRSFIHIDDTVDALRKITEAGIPGDSYHISTNDVVTIKSIVESIGKKRGIGITDFTNIAPERTGKDQAYKLDSSHLRNNLGWKDEISLSEGLDKTIDWVERNLGVLSKMPTNYQHKR